MNILFITSGSIGDAIISTGILGYLMDTYPEATFTVAVGPAAASLFEPCPRITKTISVVKQRWNKHWLLLWQQTKDTRWDLIVDLRSSLISYILNTRKRYIFKNADTSQSKAEQLAQLLGLSFTPPTRLWSSDAARLKAKTLLPEGKKAVVLAPKTNSIYKDWPIERFAELAQKLRRDNVVFVVMASGAQFASVQPLIQALSADQVVDLSGKTDLPTAYAVIEQATLFIGNDSGLLHMAAAAKAPVVGIYGPSNDKTYAPRGPHIRLITAREFKPGEEEIRGDMTYIESITVDRVEEAVRELGVL